MQGKIIKGIAGFYYIHTPGMGVYECKAKGIFRNQKVKPLVGDNVKIDILDEPMKKGNIVEIMDRRNELIRPAVSNVDQAIVIFAAAEPEPNLNLLDRFLIMMEKQDVETVICFNKCDLVTEDRLQTLNNTYKNSYKVLNCSAKKEEGMNEIISLLQNHTTVLAGPSGVGKSSIINKINPEANMEVGSVSEKIKRGRHTTRHSELFLLGETAYIMDTPGFSSLYINEFESNELKNYFPEFTKYEEYCRFQGCVHINEPDCAVKQALERDEISKSRYHNYLTLYGELKEQRKY